MEIKYIIIPKDFYNLTFNNGLLYSKFHSKDKLLHY